jgi:hypothetical protein
MGHTGYRMPAVGTPVVLFEGSARPRDLLPAIAALASGTAFVRNCTDRRVRVALDGAMSESDTVGACSTCGQSPHTPEFETVAPVARVLPDDGGSALRTPRSASSSFPSILLLALFSASAPAETPPATCTIQLTVALTADVPDVKSATFLSSLIGNHPGYALVWRGQRSDHEIDVELNGPAPQMSCDAVVRDLRTDARIESIAER